MIHLKSIFYLCSVLLAGTFYLSCNSQTQDKEAVNQGLVGYWKLTDDILDHSGNNLHSQTKSVNGQIDNLSSSSIQDRNSWLEIPSSPEWQLGNKDFSIGVWVNASTPGSNISGDILSQYDAEQRKGFHLSIKTNPSPTGLGNFRQLSFGIDDNISSDWDDCGRPGNALLAFGLTEYKGDLYAATCEPEAGDAGHVYRYDSVKGEWIDCGAPDQSNTVFALAEFEGDLYAATGKYRVAGSSLPESENTTIGGRIFRYEKPGHWVECGQLSGVEAIIGLVVYKEELYASSLYSPGFFKYKKDGIWEDCGTPNGKRVESFGVYDGYLFATSYDSGNVYRYDGKDWVDCGLVGKDNTQTYGFAVYQGELYVSTWPSGRVFVYEGIDQWRDAGRLGEELEVMGLIVYNGQLLAGTLPLAEAYIYEGDTTWRRMDQLDTTEDVKYRRAWTMAEHAGKAYCSTLPSGHIYSYEAGKTVTWSESFPSGWHHIVVVKTDKALKLYVDGKLVNTMPVPDSLRFNLDNTSPLQIGFGQHDIFKGQIKEVRLYNRVLEEDEIGLLAETN